MKPRHTKPDANQKQIEDALQALGFWVYRTADCSIYKNYVSENEFHPLDLMVVGYNVDTDQIEITLWEIKSSPDSTFTDDETLFIDAIQRWWQNKPVPINVAYSLDDILHFYGRLNNG